MTMHVGMGPGWASCLTAFPTLGDALETLVKDLAQRKEDLGSELKVTFQTGVAIFDWKPVKSAEKRRGAFDSNPKYGGGKRPGKKKMSKFEQEQAANDAFLDDMMGDLDSINNINIEIGKQLDIHTKELEHQEHLVKDTNARIKPTLKRMDKWTEDNS